MKRILLIIVAITIFFSCEDEYTVLKEERVGTTKSNWDITIPNGVPSDWGMRNLYTKFVKDVYNTKPAYQSLVAFDEHSEAILKSFGDIWFKANPLLKLFAYQIFHANGESSIMMGFDTSLRLEEKEGGVYHPLWGMYFLKAGPGINYISRQVFIHELVHAFQDKICKYVMNDNTKPFIEFEADIATDALEFVCNGETFPQDYELCLLRNVTSQKAAQLRDQYVRELTELVETAGLSEQTVNRFYNKWYKIIHGVDPSESCQANAVLCITFWKHIAERYV